MVKRSIGLELETKKKIKIGKNSIKLHGDKLDIPSGKALLINMQLDLPGHLWFVNPGSVTATTKMVSFDAHLHVPLPRPVSSDSGDLTITLLYTDDNEPIEVACEEVEVESPPPVPVAKAAKKK
jgi:hypothetical protein